jgi:PIN domain nuclease of toxin-antitoxin system
VNLLLDVHALLWFLDDGPLVSGTAKKLIEDPSNRKLVSVATRSCIPCFPCQLSHVRIQMGF